MSRRLVPLAVLAVAALLTGACADDVAPAARVGDRTITASELDAELAEWTSNEVLQDPEAALPAAPGAFEGGFARGILSQRIGFELHNAEFEALGLTVDDAIREQVITVVFGDQAAADAQLEGFSDDYAATVLDDLARQIGVANALGDDGYGAWRTEVYATTDIEISPRFGTWDRATGTVTAPPAPLPVPLAPDTVGGLPRVVVVGLGPAGPDLLTAGTIAVIEAIPVQLLRTRRHPAAVALPHARDFDTRYESAASFVEVYEGIVETVVAEAGAHGEVLYAVPGSPVVAERTVELLVADDRVAVEILPALSFLDLAWARLRVDPVALGARLVDGRRFAVEAAGERGPLLVGQCDQIHVLSDIKLALDDGPPVVVLQRLGLPDESVRSVAWDDLDRAIEPDHLTSLWIPELGSRVAGEIERFHELVRTLPRECPWDREQTHASLTRHLLEETYEVLEAIDRVDEATGVGFDELEEELGDLLFQVVFHSVLAAEEGQFTLADVARGIHDKLYARHPHVFDPTAGAPDTAQLAVDWERAKVVEKGRASVMDGIPAALPALAYALKVQKKAAAESVAWQDLPGVDPTSLAGRLLALVDDARTAGLDPEQELRAATLRLRDAFVDRAR